MAEYVTWILELRYVSNILVREPQGWEALGVLRCN